MPPEPDGEPEADAPDEGAEAPDAGPEASQEPSEQAAETPEQDPEGSHDRPEEAAEAPDPESAARDDPSDEVGPDLEGRARCPYCGSRDVVRFSRFGSEVSSQQYECKGCGAPFERLRYDGELPDTRRDED